ncbi:MAG: ThuA domain-containing protein [Pirellulales bacterium]
MRTRTAAIALASLMFASALASLGTAAEARKKIVFLPGPQSHGWSGHAYTADCKLLANLLNEKAPEVEAVVLEGGWPKDLKPLEDAAAIVIACDGNGLVGAEANWKALQQLAAKGKGIAFLHYSLDPGNKPGQFVKELVGGYYEQHWSVNPQWYAEFKALPEHPITRGVKPFAIDDEWYYHMRFQDGMKNVAPILTAIPPDRTREGDDGPHSGNPTVRAGKGQPEHLAWAYERADGGRGFGFSGGHTHWSYAHNQYRKLLLNACLWIAKVEVPAQGLETPTPTAEEMEANLQGGRPGRWTPQQTKRIIDALNSGKRIGG